MASDQQLLTAIHRFIDGKASTNEKQQVNLWYHQGVGRKALTETVVHTHVHLLPHVAAIIAAGAVEKAKHQTNQLLNFGRAIALVHNHAQLLQAINDIPKQLLGFSHTIVCTLDDDGCIKPFLCDPETAINQHPEYQLAKSTRFSVFDGVLDRVAEAESPLIFDLNELSQSNDFPLYLKINFELGIKHAVITRFPKGDEVFGFWMLFFEDNYDFDADAISLIEGLAGQLCVAVSNIIAIKKINDQLAEIKRYKQQLDDNMVQLDEDVTSTHGHPEIIGESKAIKRVFKLIDKVGPSSSTVLILGETGTGKELVARAIHNISPRKNKPMVKVNCAALPSTLIESELFGHERGSFTGATDRRLGKFELANGGTLFLDEVGEMSLEVQVKLLRALQEREIERIGGRGVIKVDVRIIAATNRDLEKEMEEGRFRRDLYYRLNIFPITLPALRERCEDIPLLASFFIKRFAKKACKHIDKVSTKALQCLTSYAWPGNIRQIEHVIERSILLAGDGTLKEIILPEHKPCFSEESAYEPEAIKTIDENERDHIYRALKFCKGRVGGELGAADILGLPASTLFSKMKKLGIRKDFY